MPKGTIVGIKALWDKYIPKWSQLDIWVIIDDSTRKAANAAARAGICNR
jgi:hypothetical protein